MLSPKVRAVQLRQPPPLGFRARPVAHLGQAYAKGPMNGHAVRCIFQKKVKVVEISPRMPAG